MPGNYSISKYRSGPSSNRAFGALVGKEHMERGRIKVMGIAKTSFLVAFWVASANFRLIDAFERQQDRAEDPDYSYTPRRPAATGRCHSLTGPAAPTHPPDPPPDTPPQTRPGPFPPAPNRPVRGFLALGPAPPTPSAGAVTPQT